MSGYGGYGHGMNFVLIVVLFILLIIVGASFVHGGY
ncbi:YjcZ family sporulation protein [Bacillus sp. JJ1521]